MARQKANPLRREPSDFNQGPLEPPKNEGKPVNGSVIARSAGEVSEQLKEKISSTLPDQPGLTQLIICVGGIYASLYVLSSFYLLKIEAESLVYPGLSSKNVLRRLPMDPPQIPSASPTLSFSILFNRLLLR